MKGFKNALLAKGSAACPWSTLVRWTFYHRIVLTVTLPGPNPLIDPVAEGVTVVAASAVTRGMRRKKEK